MRVAFTAFDIKVKASRVSHQNNSAETFMTNVRLLKVCLEAYGLRKQDATSVFDPIRPFLNIPSFIVLLFNYVTEYLHNPSTLLFPLSVSLHFFWRKF